MNKIEQIVKELTECRKHLVEARMYASKVSSVSKAIDRAMAENEEHLKVWLDMGNNALFQEQK